MTKRQAIALWAASKWYREVYLGNPPLWDTAPFSYLHWFVEQAVRGVR